MVPTRVPAIGGPSTIPDEIPTATPSLRPTGASSEGPTGQSSTNPGGNPPTPGTFVSQTLPNITITLGLTSLMSADAADVFEQEVAKTVTNYYTTQVTSRVRRHRVLQENVQSVVSNVSTTVAVMSQALINNSTELDVGYQQAISFRKDPESTVTAEDVVVEPFMDSTTLKQLENRLASGHPEFKNLASVSTPRVPVDAIRGVDSVDGDGRDVGIGLIYGIVAAVVALVVVLFVGMKLRRNNRNKNLEHKPLPSSNDPHTKNDPPVVQGDDDEPDAMVNLVYDQTPIMEETDASAEKGDQRYVLVFVVVGFMLLILARYAAVWICSSSHATRMQETRQLRRISLVFLVLCA